MKKSLLIAICLCLPVVHSEAQQLRKNYVTWPQSPLLHDYVKAWTKGEPLTTTWNSDGVRTEWEDEEFFISRVKLKPYIRNAATQVHDIAAEKDKNLLFWVPIGYADLDGVSTNALPNGLFDSEVFSMWPYVTHYGNWTSPYGWVPGAFADAAHKHGTAVSGLASIPQGALQGKWLTAITEMGNMSDSQEDIARLGDFLHYHGVDGLGYNSEYSVDPTIQDRLNDMHAALMKYMRGTLNLNRFENPWYSAVTNKGNIDYWSSLADWNVNAFGDKDNPRTIYFVNYGWSQLLSFTDKALAKVGRDPRDLYMGMDMQGGAKFDDEWLKHKEMDYSIGLWGAHDFNYIWGNRSSKGAGNLQRQECYQERIEQWFTNGNRNPANSIEVCKTMSLSPSEDWFGMSAFMTARSSLGWDLSTEPFITFFNLGNGRFLNWKGNRAHSNEWYNIGVQDYMPTWRFWWATELLGKTPDKVASDGLAARFTWDEAYVGGSCLRIQGSSDDEYLHLFKTRFDLRAGDVITVRYKHLGGKSDVSLILTAEGDETTPLEEENLQIISSTATADNGAWISESFTVSDNLAGTIALAGLHFRNAENLDLCLGEFSIRRGRTATPSAPIVTATKLLCNNMHGVDGKVFFRMNSSKAPGEPVYNLDVNTSMFKLYAQYEGGAEQLAGITSSWAGLLYSVKDNTGGSATRIRFGVSAVSADTDSESPVTWGEYMPLPDYEVTEGVEIDKKVIKPGESFTIKYTDTRHPAGSWSICDADGRKVAGMSEHSTSYTCPGLESVGLYTLVINEGTPEEASYPYLIQVSSDEKGALPEILSLSVNSRDSSDADVEFSVGEEFSLGYTGRAANGHVSQGLRINGHFIGAPVKEIGLSQGAVPFTVAAWIKPEYPEGTSSIFGIENRAGDWPRSHWGFFWMDVAGKKGSTAFGEAIPAGGIESFTFRSTTGNDLKYNFSKSVIPEGVWTHIAITFSWDDTSCFKAELYINGIRQVPVTVDCTEGNPSATDDKYFDIGNKTLLEENMWLSFGGGRGEKANFNDGIIDDIVIWQGAMTAEQVRQIMNGSDRNNLPSQILAYWDIEEEADETNQFAATGSKAGAPLCNFVVDGTQTPTEPVYDAGSPFTGGSAYSVTTTPAWTLRSLGAVSDAAGSDVSGAANVAFSRSGDYSVRLSLDNAYGSHSMEYPVFAINGSSDAIEDVTGDSDGSIRTYTVDGMLFVDFSDGGDYTVSVYDTAGRIAGRTARTISAGEKMSVRLANTGLYIVRIEKNGRTIRSIRILNR